MFAVMTKIAAVMFKEFLLLRRDRMGLLVLFVMPAVLVLVITLVQENVLKAVGAGQTRILLVDPGRQRLGEEVETRLSSQDGITIVKVLAGRKLDEQTATRAVLEGEYQIAVMIPDGADEALAIRAEAAVRRSLSLPVTASNLPPSRVRIVFDPAVLGGLRSAMRNALELVLLEVEVRSQMRHLGQLLPQAVAARMRSELGEAADSLPGDAGFFQFDLAPQRLLVVEESAESESLAAATPTSVQHNVPAWALFGIFLIAVPIAGSLIQERRSGIDTRLFSLPVPLVTLLVGKLIAYCIVCGFQFVLILLIGKFLLPALGTPPLATGSSPAGIVLMTVSAILAANGFGVLLGTVGKTYEQVSMLGPTAIVVAAALGGVMVPVYAMPEVMQKISVLSPLAWGLNGFLEIFIRRGTAAAVLPEALALLMFFAFCMLISWAVFGRDDRGSL